MTTRLTNLYTFIASSFDDYIAIAGAQAAVLSQPTSTGPGIVSVPAGTTNVELTFSGMDKITILYLKPSKELTIRLVPLGLSRDSTPGLKILAGYPGIYATEIIKLYVTNAGTETSILEVEAQGVDTGGAIVANPNLGLSTTFWGESLVRHFADGSDNSADTFLTKIGAKWYNEAVFLADGQDFDFDYLFRLPTTFTSFQSSALTFVAHRLGAGAGYQVTKVQDTTDTVITPVGSYPARGTSLTDENVVVTSAMLANGTFTPGKTFLVTVKVDGDTADKSRVWNQVEMLINN